MRRLTFGPIFILALLFYLAMNASIPVTDPVESNYALTAKEMILSGNWLSPQIYGHFWFDKPVMIYWLIAFSYKLFGITEFAARFPSALFSAASIAFIFWFAEKLFGNKKTALYAALILGTSLEFWILARMIITDDVLFFFSSVSLATFYLGIRNKRIYWYLAAYAAAGLAVLTKGPVGLVLPAIIIFIYMVVTRQWRLLGRVYLLPGILLACLIAAPWYIAMYYEHGRDFITMFFGLNNLIRATVSEHPKDNVFYYYLVLFPVSLLPWSGVLFRTLVGIIKKERLPHIAYFGSWLGGTIGFYTLMATKYPTYVFPAAFPAALWMASCLYTMQRIPERGKWLWLSLPTVFMLLIMAGLGNRLAAETGDGRLILLPVLAISLLVVIWMQVRGNVRHFPIVTAMIAGIVSLVLIHSTLIPMAAGRSDKNIVKILPPTGAVVASYGEYSTSAVFYSGYIIPHLADDRESAVNNGVWAEKYTMPVESVTAFCRRTAQNEPVYILVKKAQQGFLRENFAADYIPVAEYGVSTLYEKKNVRAEKIN
ncbi:dolichyl-phosphate-mannose-protein mannosyltransferase [Lucifera butyrica]|uniref:Dolichyl-phosphate-mannose-protein mannosyltransferase n=1 Tax=Lucifera butyrica TaxID=1351585 RepID=A0A498R6M0_9FIRM|nr:glycosyltransferase family 39 protein [Lucifera butyrica]VBB06849.1 dolichyl-phosphate-mannose-protein mannosyltransferase [Lucifera butyrica]